MPSPYMTMGSNWGSNQQQPNQFSMANLNQQAGNFMGLNTTYQGSSPLTPAIQGNGVTSNMYGLRDNPATAALSFAPSGADAPGGGSWWDGMVGSKEAPGWGGMAIGGASALANAWMGMKQYGLAKDTLAQNKQQFETNFAAQKGVTNAQMEDRQKARVASNPGAYQSPSEYMNKNGVK